ncbi:MAG: hypothetical protein H0T51_16375 [Pirellulales bacterium]|nr:hypothetical protein [Pirellulales bacterium]
MNARRRFIMAILAIGFLASALSTPSAKAPREAEVEADIQQHTEARRKAAVARDIINSVEAAAERAR